MRRLASLTFKQLRALEAVDRTGSISRAAEELGLTAPAVHSQLKTLDETFGCAMLSREGAGPFVATPEGRVLLQAYEKADAGLRLAVRRIDALQKGLAGTVVLGVVSTGKYFAPGIVARLRRSCPEIEVLLQIGNRDTIISALQDGALDLAIMGRPPRDPPLEAISLGDHPHVLIAPPDHPLAHAAQITPEEVLKETILMREQGSGTRILATRFLDRIGEGKTYERAEMGTNETIKQAVIAGLGLALISYHTVVEELRTGRLVTLDLPGLPIVRHWFLLHPADAPLSGAARTVWEFIAAEKDDFLPHWPPA
ncbi:LysR family transcriptional regulator [Salipiger sp. P9]|uniref:LysR family regulator CbbR n=1 Tax=Salipiger pentaromativorans TaxID=2943193 RepID=UPI0021574B49|nr:LysR family transcriptional regulator [Salipiger pentaromativorans]MCR8546729.1 LysR family transcriptional regulator [Salipiger pentaromativorans]